MEMRSYLLPNPVIPTGDHRHLEKIRFGSQSAEVFCKDNKRREELGLPPIPSPESFLIEELRA